jgi:hypothetical protein
MTSLNMPLYSGCVTISTTHLQPLWRCPEKSPSSNFCAVPICSLLAQDEGWMRDEDSTACLMQAVHKDSDPKITSLEFHIFQTFILKSSSCCKSPSYTGKRLCSDLTHLNYSSVSNFNQLCHCINTVHNHYTNNTIFPIRDYIKFLFSSLCTQSKNSLKFRT